MTLLGLDLLMELEADEGNQGAKDDGGQHVAAGGQEADPGHADQAPPLGSADNSEWHPMIREDGVEDADSRRAGHKKGDRGKVHVDPGLYRSTGEFQTGWPARKPNYGSSCQKMAK